MLSDNGFVPAGVPVSADTVLHTSFVSIASWLNAKHKDLAHPSPEGAQDMEVDLPAAVVLSEAGSGDAGGGPDQQAAQEQIIKKVMQELIFHSRAEVSAQAIILGVLCDCTIMLSP